MTAKGPNADPAKSADTSEDLRDRFRVYVPNVLDGVDVETELILGAGGNFVGIEGRVSNGAIFLGAGGGVFDQASYGAFRKTATAIGTAISGLTAVMTVLKSALNADRTETIDAIAYIADLGWQTYKIGSTVKSGGLSTSTGDVTLYGDESISIAAPISVSTSAAMFNSVSAGIKAGLNGAVIAGMFGGYKAEVASTNAAVVIAYSSASVIGGAKANLTSPQGVAIVEGATVEIGAPSDVVSGVARPRTALGSAPQAATSRVQVRADKEIVLEPGARPLTEPPLRTKIRATPKRIRIETKSQHIALDEDDGSTTIVSGRSALVVSDTGLSLLRAPISFKKVLDAAIDAAEVARTTAHLAAEATAMTSHTTITAAVGAHVGALVGTLASLGSGSAGKTLGGIGGGAVAGAAAAVVLEKGIAALLVARAKEKLKEKAETAYRLAIDLIDASEAVAISTAITAPTPKIEVTDTSIELSVGFSKVTITALGIDIKTPPGASVTVNGSTIASGLGGAVQVL